MIDRDRKYEDSIDEFISKFDAKENKEKEDNDIVKVVRLLIYTGRRKDLLPESKQFDNGGVPLNGVYAGGNNSIESIHVTTIECK